MAALLAQARANKQEKERFIAPMIEAAASKTKEERQAASNAVLDALKAKIAMRKASLATTVIPVTAKLDNITDKPLMQAKDITNITKEVERLATTPTGNATGMSGELITYNSKQQEFIDLVSSGQSCVLIGAAGTGKTTCSKGANAALIAAGSAPILQSDGHKHLESGSPGIIITSYTRRAVNNIRKVQSSDLKSNCVTVHKLLEYQPEYYEILDPETGLSKNTMSFEPTRHATNPLPSTICTIEVEEGSMLSTDLFYQVEAALPHKVQWIFIGDIQQLPPVFGSAILGFKMLELPVIELTEVYRQALESPIIRLAHRILSGKPIPASEYPDWKYENQLTLHPWKKKLSADNAALTLSAFFKDAIDRKVYLPDEDMILIPYNKACGTIELNSQIANHLSKKREAVTYEVMAGYTKHYFSAGDKVLYDREDAEIIDIILNPAYSGARVQPCSKHLDYWGHNPNLANEDSFGSYGVGEDDVDFLLEAVASSDERVTQSSHKIVVRLLDTAAEITITKAAEVNALLLAYALTVHKAQGSEWRKVFFCLHQSHATMLQRELLYTAVTRAREELYVICEPESFTKGIISQRIKGDTLAEKAEFFKGKLPAEAKKRIGK
jgi:exodeoxyribonuclease V alpha subunit